MILFVNFAPIEYLGGAERKLFELFSAVSRHEKSYIATVDKRISNIYGKLVLGTCFSDRNNGEINLKNKNYLSLHLNHFNPFSKDFNEIKTLFEKARKIYIKADLTEILTVLYFGGFKILKKTIAGIRSPWIYPTPSSALDRLHNIIFKSAFLKFIMGKMHKIHVLTSRDKIFFENFFNLRNIILIPNYSDEQKPFKKYTKASNKLQIVFVGELLKRKGVDILASIIKNSPSNYVYNIVGDGPLKDFVENLSKNNSNCKYKGYLKNNKLNELYANSDVLLFPSKAEGFGGVILEAMAHGLKIVDSPEISLDLPKYIEYTSISSNYNDYLSLLEKIATLKNVGNNDSKKIKDYFNKNYSSKIIIPKLLFNMLEIKKN